MGYIYKRFWQMYALVVLQLIALIFVVIWYELEEALNLSVLLLVTTGGFVIHSFLSKPYRIYFFASLSLILLSLLIGFKGMAIVFTVGSAITIIASKIKNSWLKYGFLIVIIAALIFLMSVKPGRIQPYIYAISVLGSMFMFRLSLFLYDKNYQRENVDFIKDWAYFFMLPNMSLLLFPVVDYKIFMNRYYDEEAIKIYKKGVQWIALGVLHLVLYRFVYYYLLLPPVDVSGASSFWHYAITNYLLIIRLSGLFHISVGILCLYGFNLPRVFDNYFLASGFSDLWRRINIYFRDYLIRLFYYPLFFKMRKWGDLNAKVVSILIIFAITWFLHSFQWFWLRGSFPLRTVDAVFWGVFGILVAGNAILESKKERVKDVSMNWRYAGLMTAKIIGMFLSMCILWSIWSSPSMEDWLTVAGFAISGTIMEYIVMTGILMMAWMAGSFLYYLFIQQKWEIYFNPNPESNLASVWSIGIIVLLLLMQLQPVQTASERYASIDIGGLLEPRLNRADENLLVDGYYEEILIGNELTNPLADMIERDEGGRFRSSEGAVLVDDVRIVIGKPNYSFTFKDEIYTTNSLGIRDREYPRKPADNTIRTAFLGGSYVNGSGVADNQLFDYFLEKGINALSDSLNYEFWNFGNPGFDLFQSIYDFEEKRGADYEFDNLIYISHGVDLYKNIRTLSNVLRRGDDLPYTFLSNIVQEASADGSMSMTELSNLFEPFGKRLVYEAYKYLFDYCIAHNIKPMWLFWPTTDTHPEIKSQKDDIMKMVEEIGYEVVDLETVYDSVNPRELFVSPVKPLDRHPNELGHRLIADALLQIFIESPEVLQPTEKKDD